MHRYNSLGSVEYEIKIPIDLFPPEYIFNFKDSLENIIEKLIEKYSKFSGKGYIYKNSKPEIKEEQFDISFPAHSIAVMIVAMNILKNTKFWKTKYFKEFCIGALLHDFNKIKKLRISEYKNVKEFEKSIEKFLVEILGEESFKKLDLNIKTISLFIERTEKGSTGVFSSLSLTLEKELKPLSTIIQISDEIISVTSEVSVDDAKVQQILEKRLKDIVDGKIGVIALKQSIYPVARYILLRAICKYIEEQGSNVILTSKHSVVYLSKKEFKIDHDKIIETAIGILKEEIRKNRKIYIDERRKRPNQAYKKFLYLELIPPKNKEELLKELNNIEDREIYEFFSELIYPREKFDELLNLVLSLNDENAYKIFKLIIFGCVHDTGLRKEILSNLFGYNVSFPNSKKKLEDYEGIHNSFIKIINKDLLNDKNDYIVEFVHNYLKQKGERNIEFLKKLFEYHLKVGDISIKKIAKENCCVICGEEAKHPFMEKDTVWLSQKSLVSNWYRNIITKSYQNVMRICDKCLAEFLLRKIVFPELSEGGKNVIYFHVSLSPYFPLITIKHLPEKIFSKNKVKEEIFLANPLIEKDNEHELPYLLIPYNLKKGKREAESEPYYRALKIALLFAKTGLRVQVLNQFSELKEEKPIIYFESLLSPLKEFFETYKWYFIDIDKLDLQLNVVDSVKKNNTFTDILVNLRTYPISIFSFAIKSWNGLDKGKRKRVEKLGGLYMEFLHERGSGDVELVKSIEKLAKIFSKLDKSRKDSRSQRTWIIREAFDAYLRFRKLGNKTVESMIKSRILKGLLPYVNEDKVKLIEEFTKEFLNMTNLIGERILQPTVRTYLIDAFEWFVFIEQPKGGKKNE